MSDFAASAPATLSFATVLDALFGRWRGLSMLVLAAAVGLVAALVVALDRLEMVGGDAAAADQGEAGLAVEGGTADVHGEDCALPDSAKPPEPGAQA